MFIAGEQGGAALRQECHNPPAITYHPWRGELGSAPTYKHATPVGVGGYLGRPRYRQQTSIELTQKPHF